MEEEENSIHIEREPLTQVLFDELYLKTKDENSEENRKKLNCSTKEAWKIFSSFLPLAKVIRYYSVRHKLLDDFLAGITNVLYHIPHALAFGLLASGKVENGLYSSVWPVLLYAFFGTSSHSSVGTSAVICMFSVSIVNRETTKFMHLSSWNITTSHVSEEYITTYYDYKENLNNGIVLLFGLLLVILGLLKLSFLSYFLSEPFLKAFTSGVSIHLVLNQLPEMLGIRNDSHKNILTIFYQAKDIFSKMTEVDGQTLLITVISIVILIFINQFINVKFKSKLRIPLPANLIVIVLATLVSALTDLHKHVRIVGTISKSIPSPTVPDLTDCQNYILDCFVLALLVYSNNVAISKTFAKKHNYDLDRNQEVLAHGICNFVGAFLHCAPVSVSMQRSKVLSLMNARSTLSGIFTAVFMLIITTIGNYLFEFVPKATLSVIVVFGIKGLIIQIADFRKYWTVNKYDFLIWTFTFLAVVLLNLTYGFLIGLLISLLTVVIQTQFARGFRLEKAIEEQVMVEHKMYNDSRETRGVKIFRFQSNLYYANSEIFRNKLYQQTVNPRKLLKYLKKQEKQTQKEEKRDGKCAVDVKDIQTSNSASIGKSSKDVSLSYSVLPPISEHHEAKRMSVSVESVTSLPVETPSNDSVNSILPPMNRTLSDSQSISSTISLERQQSESLSLRSFRRQQSDSKSEKSFKAGSDSQSMASVLTNMTYATEEEDSEDGQTYVTQSKFQSMRKIHHVILDFSNVNYIDLTGAKTLAQISREFDNVNIKLFLSGCSIDVQKTLTHTGVADDIPPSSLFIDIYDALEVAKHFDHLYPFMQKDEKF